VVALAFAVPGRLDQPTGGYAYDRRVIAELRLLGCGIDIVDLGEDYPRPTSATIDAALTRLQQVPNGMPIVIDGLAFGVLPQAAEALRATNPVIALVHHPLALETGLTCTQAQTLLASERAALAAARHVVVTSPATGRLLAAEYGVAAQSITVAPPGNDRLGARCSVPAPPPSSPACGRGWREGETVNLLAVGAVVPRKGYNVLIDALACLTDLDWQLVIAGDCTRDRDLAGALATRLVVLRLGGRISMAGAVSDERLGELYRNADLFVLASRHEGYGMAFAEAIAYGLPVVGTKAGAIPETVPEGTGILVPPDDTAALVAALRAMIADPPMRQRCADTARRAALRLPTWDATAQIFLRVVQALR
jgi:glycosyltransferase involved in cell wall biosynthesis